ncbi:MAG: P1 family peptidase [Nitrospirota bacterium]|nr:P1 family peptidase [Nitrospirota bacterium]MDH4361098.1 P1 family peptidase [Nitrospirota bacterium]MDH5295634.1 P1 family peptidase [Nitrospirota bacterium]
MRFLGMMRGDLLCLLTFSVLVFAGEGSAVFPDPSASITSGETRPHVKDLGIKIGRYQPGIRNAITDIPGVKVGQVTLNEGEGALQPGQGPVRTGVTVIIPREDVWRHKVPAGAFVLNGTGEMTGLAWVAESGFLEYPIALTNTLNVPRVADGVMSWMIQHYPEIGITDDTLTPVVAECDDSRLNDSQGRHVSPEDVVHALETATAGPVQEGSVGAGTGMVAYQFKGGIGTASRVLPPEEGGFHVGVLVNANHGRRHELTIAGVPVGQLYNNDENAKVSKRDPKDTAIDALGESAVALPQKRQDSGSIIIIIATDAPLDARQLSRLSRRATIGLARTGSISHHGSGDFILAFSTGNVIPHYPEEPTFLMTHLADTHLNPLFQATVEATEEAILNALLQATTVTGRDGRRFEAISIEKLRSIFEVYHAATP